MGAPRLEIELDKLASNARRLSALYSSRGIRVTAITKGVCGSPRVARALYAGGIRSFGDAHVANLQRMRAAGVAAEFMLIRSPMPSEVGRVVEYADVSLNTEPAVIRLLADEADRRGKPHRVILMVELGDLREGILPANLESVAEGTVRLHGVELAGVGTNLGCLRASAPTQETMARLSAMADDLRRRFGLDLEYVSGGNSASYQWFLSTPDVGPINHLRIGESILLGRDTVSGEPIPGLHTDAVTLVAEVIEAKMKPSRLRRGPARSPGGPRRVRTGKKRLRRAILALGRQDIDSSAITPRIDGRVLGASSDHLVMSVGGSGVQVGTEVRFDVGYSAMLRAMMSPYVEKEYLPRPRRVVRSSERLPSGESQTRHPGPIAATDRVREA